MVHRHRGWSPQCVVSGPLATADECRRSPRLGPCKCCVRQPSDGGSWSTVTVAGALKLWPQAPQRPRTNVDCHRGWSPQCVLSGPLATVEVGLQPPWLEPSMCGVRPPSDGGRMSAVTAAGPLQVLCEAAQRRWKLVDGYGGWSPQVVALGPPATVEVGRRSRWLEPSMCGLRAPSDGGRMSTAAVAGVPNVSYQAP